MFDSVDRNSMDYFVNQIIVDILCILIGKSEFSLAIGHHPHKFFVLFHLHFEVCVQTDVQFMH